MDANQSLRTDTNWRLQHPGRQHEQSAVVTSRRDLLGALAATSAGAAAVPTICRPLDREFDAWGDEPVALKRTEDGRRLSRFRYHNAEVFFAGVEMGFRRARSNLFYHVGIVMQLGLSSHLLDVGFDDQWCARHLAYRVAKSLAYANATGLGFEGPEVELLAAILTPYWRWNGWRLGDESKPVDSPFTAPEVIQLARALLDHVRRVTGHREMAGVRHG